MKYLLGSDIHGSVEGTKFLIKKFKDLKCDKLLLLGDYLGGHYSSDQKVIDILNFFKDDIIAISGNCDRYLPDDIFEFELRDDFLIHFANRFYLFSHGDNLS